MCFFMCKGINEPLYIYIYIHPITSNSQLGSFVRDSPIFCESHRTVLV